jgi:hypothetical protein
MSLISRLYAFLYWSQRHRLLGLSFRTWLVLLPIILAFAGLLRLWPLPVIFGLLGLSFLMALLAIVAARSGYKRFVPDGAMALDDEVEAPRNEHRIPLRATGIFSVHNREDYVLARPAEYWRVPLGQHVFMVQETPGRFLYQIINPEAVDSVQPGFLLYGREPQKALALNFLATWGPQFAYQPSYTYVGQEEEQPAVVGVARTVYLTFESDADRHTVWKSLLLDHPRQ